MFFYRANVLPFQKLEFSLQAAGTGMEGTSSFFRNFQKYIVCHSEFPHSIPDLDTAPERGRHFHSPSQPVRPVRNVIAIYVGLSKIGGTLLPTNRETSQLWGYIHRLWTTPSGFNIT